ncbi:MAG TPA: cell division protein SepF, partial [Bifidobacterium longum]|nr:cell division protein SepF [Bifidobacterium longum]
MAGFMKNAMSYLGMSDVVDDEDDYIEEDEEQKPASKSAFDSDHTVTPLASTTAPA